MGRAVGPPSRVTPTGRIGRDLCCPFPGFLQRLQSVIIQRVGFMAPLHVSPIDFDYFIVGRVVESLVAPTPSKSGPDGVEIMGTEGIGRSSGRFHRSVEDMRPL